MITIKTCDIKKNDTNTFDSTVSVTGSGKELIRDFYSLHEALQTYPEIALLYGIAIEKWEKEHENK